MDRRDLAFGKVGDRVFSFIIPVPKPTGRIGSPWCACTNEAPCLYHYGMEKIANGR